MRPIREYLPQYADALSERRDLCDAFVKIGGSILDHEAATAALVPTIIELAARYRIILLPGGGQTAKRIKANQRKQQTHFYDCWKAGVNCLEVNAHLLASYSRSFTVVTSLADMTACFELGNIAVFAPAGAIVSSLDLLPNWQVTTDSMGLYFASVLGARHYVIVSDVHGIYARAPQESTCGLAIPELTVAELERLPSSKLDPSFPAYFRRYPVPTVIVNGQHPSRVSAAIAGDRTVGTRILPSDFSLSIIDDEVVSRAKREE
jgi:aspartokinase-like uncharacterized kinase